MRKRKLKGKKTTCSKCGNEKELTRKDQRYCKRCHADSMIKSRLINKQSESQKVKHSCRAYTNTYLKRGNLTKEPCYNCGSDKVEAHHSDYAKPLTVHWLCRKCHLDLHIDKDLELKINSMPSTPVFKRHQFVHKILK